MPISIAKNNENNDKFMPHVQQQDIKIYNYNPTAYASILHTMHALLCIRFYAWVNEINDTNK